MRSHIVGKYYRGHDSRETSTYYKGLIYLAVEQNRNKIIYNPPESYDTMPSLKGGKAEFSVNAVSGKEVMLTTLKDQYKVIVE